MPTLNWIGKAAVVTHHRDVPVRLLEPVPELGCGDAGASGNLIVQGDNLHALKALLPRYAGQVKCIYIDPPYNTGNEGWAYNDNVNSPEIRKWLGEVVGKEGETLDRHDRWLCMMYPRLVLLKQFLREDGAIFVSIDDNKVANLRLVMDEVFGTANFTTTFIWQKVDSPNDNKVPITPDHEFVLCFEKKRGCAGFRKNTDASLLDAYSLRDDAGRLYRDRLLKKNGKNSLRADRPTMFYPLQAPDGTEVLPVHDDGREARWALGKAGVAQMSGAGRLIWKQRERKGQQIWVPYTREFAPDIPERPHPTILLDVLTSRQAKAHQRELFGDQIAFDTVKPEQLVQRLFEMASAPGDLVMDSFLGSGTTAAVALKINRRWLGIEMGDHALTHCRPRLRKVIEGEGGGISTAVDWRGGGGFQFCRLSAEPLFDATGNVRSDVGFPQLAEFAWFLETGTGHTGDAGSPLIGIHEGRAIYLLYNGILKDRSPDGGNVLTAATLALLPPHEGPKTIYAAASRLGTPRLARENAVFKQTPYALKV